jgi:hypothetical protein
MFSLNLEIKSFKHKNQQLFDINCVKLKDNDYIGLFNINKTFINRSDLLRFDEPRLTHLNRVHTINTKEQYIPNVNFQTKIVNNIKNLCFNNVLLYDTLNFSKENIKEYFNSNDLVDFNYYHNDSIASYESLFNQTLTTHRLNNVSLRGHNFITHFGFLADFNTEFKPLFSFMIKKEHLKYFKLCYLTNKAPNLSLVEFWMDNNLLNNNDFKNIKMYFNKILKPIIIQNNIEVVKVDNLLDYMFDYIKIPNFPTIKDKKEFDVNIISELFEDITIEENFKQKSLILQD